MTSKMIKQALERKKKQNQTNNLEKNPPQISLALEVH